MNAAQKKLKSHCMQQPESSQEIPGGTCVCTWVCWSFVVVFFSHDEKAVKTTGYVSQFTLQRREVDKIKSMTCVLGDLKQGLVTVSRDTS